MPLPTDAQERKNTPIYSGVLKYFPDAIAYVAKVSQAGNEQHNKGQKLHWSRGKSADHEDCAVRHLLESGTVDSDGLRHSGKLVWRALAILQLELEEAAAKKKDEDPRSCGHRNDSCPHTTTYTQGSLGEFCSTCNAPV